VNVDFTIGTVVVSINRIGLSVGEGVGWLDTGVKVLSTMIGTRVCSTARTGFSVRFSIVNVGSAVKMVGLRDGWMEIVVVGLFVVLLRPALTKVSSD
jgi:hypothetical protein